MIYTPYWVLIIEMNCSVALRASVFLRSRIIHVLLVQSSKKEIKYLYLPYDRMGYSRRSAELFTPPLIPAGIREFRRNSAGIWQESRNSAGMTIFCGFREDS